jgi:hypothetical protein
VSTEQILHPDHYAGGDAPIPLRFADSSAAVLYEDTMGELGVQTVAAVLRGEPEIRPEGPVGWGGDRFRAYRTPDGAALVWVTVWDDSAAAGRFLRETGARLLTRAPAGYRAEVVRVRGPAGSPGVRVVLAPDAWSRWRRLPGLRLNAR